MKELPGLRGFSAENIKKMRIFYEYWQPYLNRSPLATEINREEFLGISFSHHIEMLHKTKDLNEVLFYIHQTILHKWDKYDLRDRLK